MPELSVEELRDAGYLSEANRRFFHPLGLALAVSEDRIVVLDGRDDSATGSNPRPTGSFLQFED